MRGVRLFENYSLEMLIFLDTSILGYITHPRGSVESTECVAWLRECLNRGAIVCLPEVCDYELRRDYFLRVALNATQKLDQWKAVLEYVPIDTEIMLRAAKLWAESKRRGKPTAPPDSLDGDVILAAQVQLKAEKSKDSNSVIATTNIGHLEQFAKAKAWRQITVDVTI